MDRTMRFLIGLIIGIALTVGAAAYHDNNVATPPRSVADRPIVDWDAAGAAMRDSTSFVGRWWDSLLGRNQPQR
jgi:hypothetical protein